MIKTNLSMDILTAGGVAEIYSFSIGKSQSDGPSQRSFHCCNTCTESHRRPCMIHTPYPLS